jgi:1-deoxy-D-xylulose-5-phosphate reductoisomerase
MRDLVLLGSTGSIGTQAIDIVRRNPDRFRVVALGAGGGNVGLLAGQALELGVEVVGVARASVVQDLQLAFYAEAQRRGYATGDFRIPRIVAGPDAMTELARVPCDVVLNGVVGSLGLAPTLAALESGRILALANKESLVAGGPLVRKVAKPGQIVPVDSEHSALAQCLRGGAPAEVTKLILTASGGAFRGRRREELAAVTVEDALKHPTWDMGPVVTINTATMVNKGLEVIEAHELFGVAYDDIEVMVHPQSVIHSMVEFADGSTLAQASPPDMRLPMDAGRQGRCRPAIYNAANEECVAAFVAGRLPFLGIVDTLERVLGAAPEFAEPGTVEEVLAAEAWARAQAQRMISIVAEGA